MTSRQTLKPSTEQLRAYGAAMRAAEARAGRAKPAPGKSKPPAEPQEKVQPTRERLAKGGLAVQPVYNPQGIQEARAYRSKGPVEQYAGDWPEDIETAFKAYIRDAHASSGPAITINYDRSLNGGASRLGGLGNVHERVRDAYERYHWVRDRLTGWSKQILDWLALEVRQEATGRAMGLSDVGHRIFPAIKDKATTRGIAIGRLLGAGDELVKLYRLHAVLSCEPRPDMRTIGERRA